MRAFTVVALHAREGDAGGERHGSEGHGDLMIRREVQGKAQRGSGGKADCKRNISRQRTPEMGSANDGRIHMCRRSPMIGSQLRTV